MKSSTLVPSLISLPATPNMSKKKMCFIHATSYMVIIFYLLYCCTNASADEGANTTPVPTNVTTNSGITAGLNSTQSPLTSDLTVVSEVKTDTVPSSSSQAPETTAANGSTSVNTVSPPENKTQNQLPVTSEEGGSTAPMTGSNKSVSSAQDSSVTQPATENSLTTVSESEVPVNKSLLTPSTVPTNSSLGPNISSGVSTRSSKLPESVGNATNQENQTHNTSSPTSTEFSIFFVNDLHYDIFPVHLDNGTICETDEDSSKSVGGIGRLKRFIGDKRNNTNSLWLNAGSLLDGDWLKILKFQTAHFVNKILNFTYVAVGPRLFQYGRRASEHFLENLGPQILISNFNISDLKKSGDFKVGKCNISVIGFVDDSKLDTNLHDVIVSSAAESIIKEINETQTKQADASKLITIAFGTTDRKRAKDLIASVNGIDLLFYSGDCSSTKENLSDHICWDVVNRIDGKQAHALSLSMNHNNMAERFLVGELKLTLNEDCKITNFTHQHFDYSNYTSDPQTTGQIKSIAKLSELNDNLTKSSKNLSGDSSKCHHSECSLGNLFADSMLATLKYNEFWNVNSSRIALFPSALFQENKTLFQGNVTASELYNLVLNDPYIHSVMLTGRELQEILNISVNSIHKKDSNDFLHISSLMQILFNVSEGDNRNIVSINTVSASSDSLMLSSIQDLEQVYNVTMPYSMFTMDSYSHMLNGVNETKIFFHELSVVDAVVNNIKNTGFLPLPIVGTRQIQLESHTPPVEVQCASSTGTTILVTLVLTVVFIGAAYGVWWYVFKRRRGRSGSTMAMVNMD